MSNSSSGEKTEQPTTKKLRDLRKKGQIPKSKEVASVALVASFFLYLWFYWESTVQRLQTLVLLPAQLINQPFDEALQRGLVIVGNEIIAISLPYVAIVIIVAPLAHFLQSGFLLSFEPIKPQVNRLDPVQGFKKIFALNNLIELIKSVAKTVLVSLIVIKILTDGIGSFVSTPYCDLSCLVGELSEVVTEFAAYVLVVFVAVAAGDYYFQKFNFLRQNKMTKDEVKREHKSTEGDPQIKGRRRELHRELLNDDTVQKIRQATLLLRDGKRLSVVLLYKAGVTPLPIIVAMGERRLAARIADVAEQAKVPAVEAAFLAQSLFNDANVDDSVPRDYLHEVAQLLSEATASLD